MRRILLGGLGIALGLCARPALAQQPSSHAPPGRAAALGRPRAIPDPQPEPDITQTGLFRNGPARGTVSYAPGVVGTPTPVITQPPVMGTPTGAPVIGVPMGSSTVPSMVPPVGPPVWGPSGSGPSVTESRVDPVGRVPGVIVPSVAPGYDCPLGIDDPLCAGAPAGIAAADPGVGALSRLPALGRGHGWMTAELLMWWSRGTQVPALVTTSSPQFNGIVGQGDTQVLLGGSFGETFHAGGRIGGGYWFNDNECRGVDARIFWVSPSVASFSASTPPYPILARPFFNVNGGVTTPNIGFGPSAEVVAGQNVATGRVIATMKSTVWGAEANYRRYLLGNASARMDLLVGYRYLDVREQLDISEQFTRLPGSDMTVGTPAVAGTIVDSFRTQNQFHGGQIGLAGTVQRGRWSLDSRATIAFGTVNQSVDINGGQTLVFANGTTTHTAGGLLAIQGANIGHFSQNRFAVVPEVGFNIGWQATDRLKLFVGYNFLYLSNAVRPGGAIDTSLDAARVPNLLPAGTAAPLASVPRPQPVFHTSGYFVQGINFGLMYRFGGGWR